MKDDDFDELIESVKEAGCIHRGEIEASRTFENPKNRPDLLQKEFDPD